MDPADLFTAILIATGTPVSEYVEGFEWVDGPDEVVPIRADEGCQFVFVAGLADCAIRSSLSEFVELQ